MESVQIDWLAVVVAAVLNMVIGYFWYSKALFGDAWKKLADGRGAAKENRLAAFWGLGVSLVIAYFIALFQGYLGVATVSDGVFVGFCFWLGFVATTQIAAVIWCQQPLKLFFIETGYKLLAFLVMGGVIGA